MSNTISSLHATKIYQRRIAEFGFRPWRRRLAPVAALGTAVVLSGCQSNDLPDFSNLGPLRVVAIVSEPPEVSPGASVQITPWISDMNGNGRALTYTASACLDPGVAAGANPTCAGSSTLVSLGTGSATLDSAHLYSGAAPAFTVNVPAATVMFAERSPIDQFNGVNYLVTYTLTAADGTSVSSIKRVVVSAGKTANSNPVLSDLLANGSSLASSPGTAVSLSSSYPTSSVESYQVMDSQGNITTQTETLITTWLVSSGTMEFDRTLLGSTTTFTPDSPVPPGPMVIMGVLRDGRGGTAVLQKTF